MADQIMCPGCGAGMSHLVDGTVRHECPSCAGRVVGLAPFERMLEDGLGSREWVASAEGAPGPFCPFCGGQMHLAPGGTAMCRLCQQVWIPAGAQAWMSAHAAGGNAAAWPAPAPARPATCENCGAPFQPDENGQCKFCQAQLEAPPAPVIIFNEAPDPQPAAWHTGSRLIDGLASILTQPLD